MLNERQLKILDILKEDTQWIKGKALASLLQVSGRTIRTDIEKINFENGNCIASSPQTGYAFVKTKEIQESDTFIPQTVEERMMYILRILLQKKEYSVKALLDDLCISEFTLDHDLKKVRNMLHETVELKVKRIKNFISLEGTEEEKRKLYKILLDKETKGNFLNFDTIASLFYEIDLYKVKAILESVLKKQSIDIRKTTFPMIMMHIGIAIERIRNGDTVNSNTYSDCNTIPDEFTASNEFYDCMELDLKQKVNLDERMLLAYLLAGKENMPYSQNQLHNQSIKQIIDQIVVILHQNYDVDFTRDEELQIGLSLHLHSLLYRVEANQQASNVFLVDIKRKYPLVFDMSVQICNYLCNTLNIAIDENEIGFIALHVGTAYERNNIIDKYKALLIIPHEDNFIEFCKGHILEKFSERIEIIACLTYYDMKMIEQLSPDLILTTVSIPYSMNIPMSRISILFNSEDESTLLHALNTMDKQKSHAILAKEIHSFIKPEYFYVNQVFETPEEIIAFMCGELEKDHQIDGNFKESVLQRENMSSTSFFYSFATPHPLHCQALRSNIAIMLLKKPLQWGDFQVRFVLLLAIQKEDRKVLKLLFNWLAQTASNVEEFQKIFTSESYDEFLQHFLNYQPY